MDARPDRGGFAVHHVSFDTSSPSAALDDCLDDRGRPLVRLEIRPATPASAWGHGTLLTFGDLVLGPVAGAGITVSRTPWLVALDETEKLVLCLDVRGALSVVGRNREVTLSAGDAALLPYAEPGSVHFPVTGGGYIGLQVERAAIEPRVTGIDEALMRPVPHDSEAVRLLTRYLSLLWPASLPSSQAVQHALVDHVHDLVALTVGATLHGDVLPEVGGLRAARLASIKADVDENLSSGDVSPSAVAARQGITPRYVRKLFNEEDTSFSRFVLKRRLERARQLLENPRYGGQTITDIAFRAGFKDLSYFNRCFRQRYRATPSDVRARVRPRSTRRRCARRG